MNKSKKILLSVLGNSKYHNETSYIFRDQESEDFNVKHWYSTYALLKYLKEKKNQNLDAILIIYPDIQEGIQSFDEGWEIQKKDKNFEIFREPVKILLKRVISDNCEIRGIKVPNIESEKEIWQFLTLLSNEFNKIENCSVIIDITHGFRLFQSLIFSFVYYFENISSNKLEKIYYAIYQGEEKESLFVELDQLIMLQQEISRIKLLVENLDISAYEWIKGKVRALRSYISTLQKVMLYIGNGIVSKELLEKINFLLEEDRFKYIPKDIFVKYDKFYRHSFLKGIIPEIKRIKKKIFGKVPEKTKIWQRQLNLADLLLTQKMDFSTALQLIRESFITWLCEDVLNLNPFDMDNRKESGSYFGKLKQAQISKDYSINDNKLFSLISKLADERNNFAHVFTTKEKIQLIEKRSKNIIAYMTEIKEDIQDIARFYKLNENKEFFKNVIPNLETLE